MLRDTSPNGEPEGADNLLPMISFALLQLPQDASK